MLNFAALSGHTALALGLLALVLALAAMACAVVVCREALAAYHRALDLCAIVEDWTPAPMSAADRELLG